MSVHNAAPTDSQESHDQALAQGSIPVEGGGQVTVRYAAQDFKDVYLDEYTREPLPHHLVRAAIKDELDYFNTKVWELSDAKRLVGRKAVRSYALAG